MDEPHADETLPEQSQPPKQVNDAPPPGTAGAGNSSIRKPAIDGGQPAVGEEGAAENRNTEF